MIRPSPTPTRAGLGRVAWTRGEGCRDLAHLLADDPIRIEGDLRASCIDRRVELLVARKLTSFDLVPVVVAHDLDRAGVASVTAAVAEGPHSGLVARVAGALARGLEVPGEFATVVREPDERADARRRLESLHDRHPGMTLRIVERPTAAGLVETLAEDALLVVGAAGGSWLQRQLLGPGHRLLVNAPGGAVVVRDAPRRAFHRMVDAAGFGVGPGMAVRDAVQVVHHASVPVADGGKLVGIFRPAATHDESATVAEVMETPVSIRVDEPLEAASALRRFLEGGPVPVVDREADLAGVVL